MAFFLHIRNNKFARQALLTNYGINRITSAKLIGIAKLNPHAPTNNLRKQRQFLGSKMKNRLVGYKKKFHDYKRLMLSMKNALYRGVRHLQHLPVRGQRTHTNAGTQFRQHNQGKYFPLTTRRKRTFVNNKLTSSVLQKPKKHLMKNKTQVKANQK